MSSNKYHEIMKFETADRRGNSPLSCEQEHDYVLLTVARNQHFQELAALAVTVFENQLKEANEREEAAFIASSGEASWRNSGGPNAVIDAATVQAKLAGAKILSGLGTEQDKATIGFLSFNKLGYVLSAGAEASAHKAVAAKLEKYSVGGQIKKPDYSAQHAAMKAKKPTGGMKP